MLGAIAPLPRARSLLACSRISFGAIALVRTTPLFGVFFPAREVAVWPLAGWPEIGWHATLGPPLPAWALGGLCVLRTLAWASFTLGVRARAAGLVAASAGALVASQDLLAFTSTSHLLLTGTVLLAVVDSSTTLAIRPTPVTSFASSATACRAVVAAVYGWAALAKLHSSWLDGRTFEALAREGRLTGVGAAIVGTSERRVFLAPAVVIVEAVLAVSLVTLEARARFAALGVALAFHASLEAVVRPDVFGWAMLALLVSVVPSAPDGPALARC